MKKTLILLLVFFNLSKCSEQTYSSNYNPDKDVIEKNYNQINTIKNRTVVSLEYLIKAIKKIEKIKAEKTDKSNIKATALYYGLIKTLKFIQEHQLQKALDTLKHLKKIKTYNNIKELKVHNFTQNQLLQISKNIEIINKICSKWLADTISKENNIELPDVVANIINEYALPYKELIFKGHTHIVKSISYSPCGKYIASGSYDQTIRVWDIETQKEIKRFTGHTDRINSVFYSPCGKYIVSGSNDKTVRIWDIENQKEIKKFTGHIYSVTCVCYSPCGKHIASASYDNTLRVWDLKIKRFDSQTNPANLVPHSSCGKIASSSQSKTAKMWDIKIKKFEGHTGFINSMCYSPCGKYIASGSDDETVRIWDIEAQKEIKRFEGHKYGVASIYYSPCGKYIASGSYDGTVRVWDIETQKETKKKYLTLITNSLCYSPCGKYIVLGLDNTVRIWAVPEVAIGKDMGIETTKKINRFNCNTNRVTSVCYSPCGKYIASGSWDYTVRIWGKPYYA